MEECFKCGVSEQKAKLYDAISGKGLVKVCQRCSVDGDLPVIRKKDASLDNADKTAPVGGLIREREKAFEQIKAGRRNPSVRNQDFSLRDLVEQNYRKNIDEERKSWPGVLRNFNWVILRARRNKGFGQRQLADMIGEPEIAIRMVERGILPKEYVPFVRKLEKVLEIGLMENHPFRLEEHKRMLDFKSNSSSKLTIADLDGVTKKKEVEMIKSSGILVKERFEKEAKEQKLLDSDVKKEAPEEESYEEKKSAGFFKRLFSKKEKTSEAEENKDSESSEDEQSKDMAKSSSAVSNPPKEMPKPVSPAHSSSKEVFKSDSPTPGRTRPVPKYRWQK